jgi:hypothetical protein
MALISEEELFGGSIDSFWESNQLQVRIFFISPPPPPKKKV